MNDPRPVLSPAGQARRDAMLEDLLGTMKRVHGRRRMVARAGSLLMIGLVAGLGVMAQRPDPVGDMTATEPRDVPAVTSIITVVNTDPAILDRYRPAATARAEILDHDGLLAALVELNRPAGLIITEGRVRLTASVADVEVGKGAG